MIKKLVIIHAMYNKNGGRSTVDYAIVSKGPCK